ncbi:probable flavin-containing monoamine oxidase A isoform X1 [Polypterus senegalus]|uniref:probable flavin-containing monoamine oxidase A isoform X1 n=1 Tax=Polypterus senegalus TaxID=55291 RepID=UPI0019643D76|nr:probable flavin-containing monoamine oxidase A isoform X1 [Polypterus senegalus]
MGRKSQRAAALQLSVPANGAAMWDVVIVGAGLSGLTAAWELLKSSPQLQVLVLEGKGRVGGRTQTVMLPCTNGMDMWDLGGQWVGRTQHFVLDLIKDLGLEIYPQYTSGWKLSHLGGPDNNIRSYYFNIPSISVLALIDLQLFIWKIERLRKKVAVRKVKYCPQAAEFDSITVKDFMGRHLWTQEAKECVDLACRAVFGMESNVMSFLYFLMYSSASGGFMPLVEATYGSAQEFRIKGGAQQLSERLADSIGRENILLNSAVTAIHQDLNKVEVRTKSKYFLCKKVIVSCPPHLAAKIQYEPSLGTERHYLMSKTLVGHMIKFIVTYETAFWRDMGLSGEIVNRSTIEYPICVTYDATSSEGNPAIVGFISGEQAVIWSQATAEERESKVIASLTKFLGLNALFYIHYEDKDWSQEAFNGGCPVSVMAPKMLTSYYPGLRYRHDSIHFAGTETADVWCGYMDGAVQSGRRSALEVLIMLSFKDKSLLPNNSTVTSNSQDEQGRRGCWRFSKWHLLGATALTIVFLWHLGKKNMNLKTDPIPNFMLLST